MRKKRKDNYLDYIPVKNPNYNFTYDKNKFVVIEVVHTGIYNKIAQKFFKAPQISNIALDKYGSFIWKLIDSKNSIYDISMKVKIEFGDDAEPLYNRLVKYFQILKDQNFVKIKKM